MSEKSATSVPSAGVPTGTPKAAPQGSPLGNPSVPAGAEDANASVPNKKQTPPPTPNPGHEKNS